VVLEAFKTQAFHHLMCEAFMPIGWDLAVYLRREEVLNCAIVTRSYSNIIRTNFFVLPSPSNASRNPRHSTTGNTSTTSGGEINILQQSWAPAYLLPSQTDQAHNSWTRVTTDEPTTSNSIPMLAYTCRYYDYHIAYLSSIRDFDIFGTRPCRESALDGIVSFIPGSALNCLTVALRLLPPDHNTNWLLANSVSLS
jgi:hypothetical protein